MNKKAAQDQASAPRPDYGSAPPAYDDSVQPQYAAGPYPAQGVPQQPQQYNNQGGYGYNNYPAYQQQPNQVGSYQQHQGGAYPQYGPPAGQGYGGPLGAPQVILHEPNDKAAPYYFMFGYFAFLVVAMGAGGIALLALGIFQGAILIVMAIMFSIAIYILQPQGCTVTQYNLLFPARYGDYFLPYDNVGRVEHYSNMCCSPVFVCVKRGLITSMNNVFVFHVANASCSTAVFFCPKDVGRFLHTLRTQTPLGPRIVQC